MPENFEQKGMPTVHECGTYEELQAFGDQMTAEGFVLDRNVPNDQLNDLVASYQQDSEIAEVRLSSAFTQASRVNGFKGEPMPDHTCVWMKVDKKQ